MMKKFIFVITLLLSVILLEAQTVSVADYYGDRQAAISLTFDDGVQEHYTLVAPHLDRYGLKGTFAINGKFIGDIDDRYAPRMTWDECRELVRNGHELSNHSWSHENLFYASKDVLMKEITKNDSIIVAETGVFPSSFIFPFNAANDEVIKECEKGRTGSRRFQFALGQRNSGCTEESIKQWVKTLIENREWGVAMTHGIYTGWDQWDEPWILWDFFKDLSYQSDTIWTDTFSNVQAYIKERDEVVLKTNVTLEGVTVTPTLYLDSSIFKMPLTLKIEGMDMARHIEVVQDGKRLNVTAKKYYYIVDIDPYGSPVAINYIDTKTLKGKKITFIGDSYINNHNSPHSETWHYKTAVKNNMHYRNLGINGNCIAYQRDSLYGTPLYVRYTSIDKDTDYIIIAAGHNDAYSVNEDLTQHILLREKIKILLEGLKRDYPNAKIGWVTPWNVEYEGFPATLAIIKEVCKTHGIPVLDAARTSGIEPNNENYRRKYFQWHTDRAHLNDAGHDLLIHWGEQFLINL